ncbi:MAG: SIR2 family protein [Terrisporobacter sp.]|uniref:SIR2 family protein n=1 Tax=Terrisporobacter sp. TaxID=1965305 RepID=UPI002FCBA944
MKICIFLGAGASAAENLPIQNELFSNYFKYILPNDKDSKMNKELRIFFKDTFDIDVLEDNLDKVKFPTFEEVIGILDMAEQRRESFKNFGTETYDNKNGSINILRQYLILLTANSINNPPKSSHKYHELLIKNLIKENLLLDTTFISVNYDIHIDNNLSKLYDTYKIPLMLDYGVDLANFYHKNTSWKKPEGDCIKLYKIHGSLNWLYCPICSSLTLTPYEGGVMRILNNIDEARCLNCGERTIPIIVPPTYFKNMSNVHLSNVWIKAEKALRQADLLIFCGYSFPDADIHIKYLLKRVQTSREKYSLKIMVFNNHENKTISALKKEEDRYKRFLGKKVIFTRLSFQDFAQDPMGFITKASK